MDTKSGFAMRGTGRQLSIGRGQYTVTSVTPTPGDV
jgi:hypothetical protein